MKPKAVLTFDLEFWYNSRLLKNRSGQEPDAQIRDHLEEQVPAIMNLLKQNNAGATFFVLGQVAEKYPALIKKIKEEGFEIGSHGQTHAHLSELTPAAFQSEISASNALIKNLTGQKALGFRAPNFSLSKRTDWAFPFLKKAGIVYDSSAHPLKLWRGGDILPELPASLGGFYFRLLPLGIFIFLSKLLKKTEIPVFYLHPHELFDSSPKISRGSWLKRKLLYIGTHSALKKFTKFLEKFEFISAAEYLKEKRQI